jgi:glycosyltransferase involved in cell wall biosynthesis
MENKIELTVAAHLRNEADVIEGILDNFIIEIEKITPNYELIVTNAPSKDNSYEVIANYAKDKERVFPLNVTNIHGDSIQKGYQMMVGAKLAKGDKVILTDSDQVDPKDFKKLLDQLDDGYDVSVGWRKHRKGKHGFIYNFTSWGQNQLTKLLTGVKLHDKNSGLKAFNKRAAKSLVFHGRNFRDLLAQMHGKDFKLGEVEINWLSREGGIQNFKFIDRLFGGTLDFMINVLMVKMNDKPFRFWGAVSAVSLVIGLVASIFSVLLLDSQSLLTLGLFISGILIISAVIFLALGVILEYIVDKKEFSVADYAFDDPKGIVKARLG